MFTLEQLRSKNQKLNKDKKRLNWLIDNGFIPHGFIGITYVQRRALSEEDMRGTVRKAIDKAVKAGK